MQHYLSHAISFYYCLICKTIIKGQVQSSHFWQVLLSLLSFITLLDAKTIKPMFSLSNNKYILLP